MKSNHALFTVLLAAGMALAGTTAGAQDADNNGETASPAASAEASPEAGSNAGSGAGSNAGSGPGGMRHGQKQGSGHGSGPGMGHGMGHGGKMMGGCPMMGGMGFGKGGKMSSHAEGRIAFLRSELEITDAQKAAFDGYADAVRKNVAGMEARHKAKKDAGKAEGPVERLDRRIKSMEDHLTAMKAMKGPLEVLYGALNDDQKKKADGLIAGKGCK